IFLLCLFAFFVFFFHYPATTDIYTLSLHDALPILALIIAHDLAHVLLYATAHPSHTAKAKEWTAIVALSQKQEAAVDDVLERWRSEEHTSELQSLAYLVCRLLLEKKKKKTNIR